MRWQKTGFALFAVTAVCLSSTAHAAHWNVGVFLGPQPYYYPAAPAPYVPYSPYPPYYYAPYPPPVVQPYYPPAYYAPPPVVIQPAEPDVYIERSQVTPGQGQAAAPAQKSSSGGTWWYCDASKSYYPYAKDCSSGWREVPSAPPGRNR
ncbi:hypothetical protein LJR230_002609 [Trinickia sp. LjRoot230]|uniref:hypothetical protein n=1 Tax=Trinickia sp. LjRoot230 TaxID=3342288 RepID=UPI003ECFB9BD